MFGKDEFADYLYELLVRYGVDPFYFSTVVIVLVALSYHKHIKNWKTLEDWRKALAGSAIFAAVVFSLISLLRLVGIIDL
jgi:hypothetical protein